MGKKIINKKSLPPNTTAEQDTVTAGQRVINLKWETTQQIIAIVVTLAFVGICDYIIIAGDKELRLPAFIALGSVGQNVLSTYLTRTNHTKVGGVGAKIVDQER